MTQPIQLRNPSVTQLYVIHARAKERYGFSTEETVGKRISVIYAPEERDWLPHRVLERVQRQGRFHTTGRRVTRDGKSLTVDSHLTLLKDDAGEPTGVLCMCNDITEKLGLKAQLLTAVEDEQQRLGHDLHDLLGSQLTGMAILTSVWAQEVGAGKRTVTRKELDHLAVMIQETVTQARGIARGLAAGRVEEFGLRGATLDSASSTIRRRDFKSGREFCESGNRRCVR